MSDFVAWLSPLAVPEAIRRRWSWSESGLVGIRRKPWTELGQCRQSNDELIFVGHGRGERGNRHFPPADPLALRLLQDLHKLGADGLNIHLGPTAGVFIQDAGRQVTIWRDRFGRHPLQMIRLSQGWAVTTCPEFVERLSHGEPRWSNIAGFIHNSPSTAEEDVFLDVFRIRPSEAIIFRDHEIHERRRWWNPERQQVTDPVPRMTSLLQEIGELYGRSPHVIALSAGLDSATLAAVISRWHPSHEALTFTDPGSPRNEGPWAADVADHLRLSWKAFRISEHWPLSRPDDHRFPVGWGPPAHPDFAWKIPFHRWLRRRRPTMPVIYGNGADEALWFPPYLWLQSRWHHGDWSALSAAYRHLPLSRWLRPGLSAAVDALALRDLRSFLPEWPTELAPWQQPSTWLSSAARCDTPPRADRPEERLYLLRLWRLHTWRWERVMRSLAYEARRSRRAIRTPFLDAEFWELCLSLRPTDLVQGGRQKAILRHAVSELLPARCYERPKVGGFDSVVERGLAKRAPRQVYAYFSRPHLRRWSSFDTGEFLRAYEEYRRPPTDCATTYRGSWAIWKTVACELWLRRHGLSGRHTDDRGL